jgi:hypothetical protein
MKFKLRRHEYAVEYVLEYIIYMYQGLTSPTWMNPYLA